MHQPFRSLLPFGQPTFAVQSTGKIEFPAQLFFQGAAEKVGGVAFPAPIGAGDEQGFAYFEGEQQLPYRVAPCRW